MNKLVKGSIAGAAGIALLLGGAGSFALWGDGATINPGSVTSGELFITPAADGAWLPELTLIVPGDTTTYTETFGITATGDNLDAEITTNIAAVTGSITGATSDVTFTVTDGLGDPVVPVAGVYSLGAGDYTVEVEIVVDFDAATSGTTGQDESINFDGLEISVDQV